MKLSDVSRSMMKPFHLTDGRSFFGELVKPQGLGRPDNFDSPRRLLRTGVHSVVQVGQVMVDATGVHYLIMSSDATETPRLTLRMFLLIEMTTLARWSRTVSAVDAVTKLDIGGTPEALGSIWCALEAPTSYADNDIRVKQLRYRVVTGADLQNGDVLNGTMKVITVTKQLGVTFAEVE